MKHPISILLIMLAVAAPAMADEQPVALEQVPAARQGKPLWEIGFAGAVFSMPQYIGSDQRYALGLGVPYLIYRGKFLRADREGVRGRLFESDRLSLDLDFSFGLPVKNGNNARQGMPPLRLTGEAGPQLNWIIAKNEASKLSLHLPARFAMDTSQTVLGWVFEPGLRYQYFDLLDEPGKLSLRLEGGALFAQARYNRYYYGVDPAFATASRPAYRARQGLHSYYLDSSLRYKLDDARSIGLMVRMRSLTGSVNATSPLVRRKIYLSAGIGFAWSFWFSQERVQP